MIVVFTPIHGASHPVFAECLKSIDAFVPGPFLHWIGDDFSPDGDHSDLQGPVFRDGQMVGQRIVYHCRDIGCTESPNLGTSLKWVFEQCCQFEFEALLSVESDVILRPGIIEGFREAAHLYGDKCGAVAPLFTEVGSDLISSFGGMIGPAGGEPRVLSLDIGKKIGSWDMSSPRIDTLMWMHLASAWIPSKTIRNPFIRPDPNFKLYYVDHALSYSIREQGLEIVVTDRAVAEHTRGCSSTGRRWPDTAERVAVETAAYQQLKRAWPQHH